MSISDKKRLELFSGTLALALVDEGSGPPILILHGGAGPNSVLGLTELLKETARVITPTHPGFDGEPRPERISRIDDLALTYLALIEKLNLSDVLIVGNSIGGWIAAEIALRQSSRVRGIVLLNAVGIEGNIADLTKISPAERMAMSFHDPVKFSAMQSSPSPEALDRIAGNQRALRVFAGEPSMYDPSLQARLVKISVPTLVAWGESDRIVDLTYGRQYANQIPNARFELIGLAGHLPQVEQTHEVARLVIAFRNTLR